MAEKEERYISITQMVAKENIETEKYRVMPRSEAIERIAKSLYLFNREDEWYKEHADLYSKYMNKMAEAALNALLEGK